MGDKSEEEELEGCRDIITEDRVSKRIRNIFSLIGIGSKRLQAFIWHVAETMQIPAWMRFAGRGRNAGVSEMQQAACRGPMWNSNKLLLAMTREQRYSSGSGTDPHSSLQDS